MDNPSGKRAILALKFGKNHYILGILIMYNHHIIWVEKNPLHPSNNLGEYIRGSCFFDLGTFWNLNRLGVVLEELWKNHAFFPTCQVRVVRFYVSTGPPSSSSSFSSSCRPPQLRSCEFSVACWTPTAILWVQCGVLDPNRDPASAVWRAGPQLRSCEFSVAGRTPTVISWVQCCVPDLNCDSASSVWRAGPQLRLCEFSVACRTSPVMERIGSSCRKSVSKK